MSLKQDVETSPCVFFGAAFELGRHEWFALRRLITNSRSSAFTGSFLKLFPKETAQEDGRNKNWTMQRLLHGILRLRYTPTGEQIQNGRIVILKTDLDIASKNPAGGTSQHILRYRLPPWQRASYPNTVNSISDGGHYRVFCLPHPRRALHSRCT